jgi:hypothetical protein
MLTVIMLSVVASSQQQQSSRYIIVTWKTKVALWHFTLIILFVYHPLSLFPGRPHSLCEDRQTEAYTNKRTDKPIDWEKYEQTVKQKDRQTDWLIDWHTDQNCKQTNRSTDWKIDRHNIQAHWLTYGLTDRQTGKNVGKFLKLSKLLFYYLHSIR